MAGEGPSEMILFVGALIAASALAGAGIAIAGDISNALEDRIHDRADRLSVDLEIINDPRNVSTNPLVLHILNTGELAIDASDLIVFVDNEVTTDFTSSSDTIHAGSWASLSVSTPTIGAGDHVVRVIDPRGAEDELRFYEAAP